MHLFDLKKQVLEYAQRAYKQELMAGTCGNLSVLAEDGHDVGQSAGGALPSGEGREIHEALAPRS